MTSAKYNASTPTAISELVKSFCADLQPNGEPAYVQNEHFHGAMMGRCYVNVAAFCQRNGGEVQYG